ncbi:MAG: tetratricopeptide repeat protein [Chitinophagaceae bacterium]|nr:tetratricopeptide repeat protein [Chitinophagaceae bacterium]
MRSSFICFLLLLAGSMLKAQSELIQPFIDAWKETDTSQSRLAQGFYDAQHREKDTAFYLQVTNQLQQYIKDNPSKRLEARFILYQTLGALEFGYTMDQFYLSRMQKAIRLALDLDDDQLTAEIYSVYAGISGPENYLLYNLKAYELQKKIGLQHFFFIYTRVFDLSRALFLNQDYQQSIRYGQEFLNIKITDLDHYDPLVHVFQLDILGACYKKLGKYDSARFYYEMMQERIVAAIPNDPVKQELWTGIGKGNLGHILILQGKYEEAIPLIRAYLQSSIASGDALNIAMAHHFLGTIEHHRQQYDAALTHWRNAWSWSRQAGSADYAIQASGGLATVFRHKGRMDSAWHYFELHHQLRDSLATSLSQQHLSNLKARINFDELESSFKRAQVALQKEKAVRNLIMAGIAVLALIVILLYNRRRLKQKLAWQLAAQQQKDAEQEIRIAREQIRDFKQHIVEKNNLIASLEAQISEQDQQQNQQQQDAVALNLQQYTLLTDMEWEKFKLEFAKAYPDFLSIIRQRIAQITPAEERLATLIFLQLSTYEIASSLGISKDSVLRSKRRLKQRLQLEDPVTVEEYLYSLLAAGN